MQLTDLQLEIQKLWADKSVSFGCIIKRKWDDPRICVWQSAGYWFDLYQEYSIPPIKECQRIWYIDWYYDDENNHTDEYEILGHPITRWRLCYLNNKINIANINIDLAIDISNKFNAIETKMNNNPSLYNQDILEWDEKTLTLVRDFLLSIQ